MKSDEKNVCELIVIGLSPNRMDAPHISSVKTNVSPACSLANDVALALRIENTTLRFSPTERSRGATV
jgi:hypothetical protein